MKQLLTRIILLGGAFCISVSLNSCNEKKAPEKITPHVKVQDIKLSDIPVSYDYPGLLQGVISYNVISRISGVVDKQSYEEGSKVKAGDELYEIDPRPYIAALSQANAQLIKDKTQVNNYKKIYDRYTRLYALGAVSKQDLETAQINYDTARSSLGVDEALVVQAKLDLTYTKVIAPASGFIGERKVSVGDTVTAFQTVLNTVSSESKLYLLFSMPENDRLSIKQAVNNHEMSIPESYAFTLDAELANGNMIKNAGIVTFKDSQLATNTGVWSLRANIYESQVPNFVSGEYLHVYLNGAKYLNSVYIPQDAVLFGSKGAFVYVVGDDSKVTMRDIGLGRMMDTSWAVKTGLSDGDKIIISGQAVIKAGESVIIDSATQE